MNELDAFGKLIAENLRDSALNRYLDIESGQLCSDAAELLNNKLSAFTEDQKQIVRELITESVDTGIHNFLFAIEEKRNTIKVTIEGQDVTKLSDGIQGEIFTVDGWFEKFSQHKEKGI